MKDVSIHATLAGGDKCETIFFWAVLVSIHATLAGGDCRWDSSYTVPHRFYPRHPRGWRHRFICNSCSAGIVSIHATLAGGDACAVWVSFSCSMFLSTPPSRVATVREALADFLAGSFYPRHPRGWRPTFPYCFFRPGMFLSTPPSRVATRPYRFLL